LTKVKICGISDVATALSAATSGADYIGLVFAKSPRQVNPDQAAAISQVVHRLAEPPQVVGVFVNLEPDEVNRLADYCRLDMVQLSGDEDPDYCRQIQLPFIKSIHIGPSTTAEELYRRVEAYCSVSNTMTPVLLDNRPDKRYGGSGTAFDWGLAVETSASFPLIVAGGLGTDNVGKMIEMVHPFGVDASSRLEKEGAKDHILIDEFIRRAKSAGGGD
jgi:phosphoribosylanthranilate isomerase